MDSKEQFITMMKARTKKLAIDVIAFVETLKKNKAASVITYQVLKSATSTAANYRAACIARSKKEFHAKICIVAEEADETVFWLEVIQDAKLSSDEQELHRLLDESTQISKIVNKAKNTNYN